MGSRLFFCILVTAACLVSTACLRYAANKPSDENLIGRYIPQDRTEKGIRANSELILYPKGRCKLIDFPIANYDLHIVHFDYYELEGSWKVDNSSGNWKLIIGLPGLPDIELRILDNHNFWRDVVPYKICQEGEDLEDDSLIFERNPLQPK